MKILVCPKCSVEIDDTCEVCYSCGMEFKHIDTEISSEKTVEKISQKPPRKIKVLKHAKLIKIIGVATIALVLIIVIFIFLSAIFATKGEKIAEKLSKKIGEQIVDAESFANVHLAVKSASNAINKQGDFNYIFEADNLIKVDGVKVPNWTIKVVMKDSEVFSIYYRDYREQKNYYKGEKLQNPIDTSKIEIGISKSKVESIFNISPLSITYYQNTADFRYVYYFINSDKDEESRQVVVTFDEKMKVQKVTENELNKTSSNVS